MQKVPDPALRTAGDGAFSQLLWQFLPNTRPLSNLNLPAAALLAICSAFIKSTTKTYLSLRLLLACACWPLRTLHPLMKILQS